MFKKFLCIFFSLVVCCVSLVVPCSYAEDDVNYELPSNYYYYGNSDYIEICSELYSKACQNCASGGKTIYDDFAVIYSASQNQAWCFFYTESPVFELNSNGDFYYSQSLRWHYFLFDTSTMSITSYGYDFQNKSYPCVRIFSYSDGTIEDFGVLNIHGYDDYLTAENTSSGYVDDDGKTQIKSTLNVNPSLYGNGSSGSGSHQLYSGTNFSLSSLQMSTRNVLSFFQYVFGYFPSQFWNAFYFILVCIVVFAFIKLLKG